jgi:bile acid-coenzyme A ligase
MVSFPHRLADLAAQAPDRAAVVCGEHTLTRSELERAANRMAHDLAQRGVGHGDFVTVALPNSLDWFVAYVAIWKLGAVPQPVSAKLPARELAAIVELANSKVVIGVDPASDVALQLHAEVDCIPWVIAPPTPCRTIRCLMPSPLRGKRRHLGVRPAARN